jgi:hypothetical protein
VLVAFTALGVGALTWGLIFQSTPAAPMMIVLGFAIFILGWAVGLYLTRK